MKFGDIDHRKNLYNYPRSARYKDISGLSFLLSFLITFVIECFTDNGDYISVVVYILWSIVMVIFSESQYLTYASRDKLYYCRKYTYDGDIVGSISDGMFVSILSRNQ